MAAAVQADGTLLDLFGSGGGAAVAARLTTADEPVPLLATIPLSTALRQGGDTGLPVVLSAPTDPAAQSLNSLAATLERRGRNLAGRPLPVGARSAS